MATISKFRQRLRAINDERILISLVFEQIERYKGILIDLVQIQLEDGQNPKGEIVGRYKRSTELQSLFGTPKPLLPKKEGDPFNFQWTGGYFDGMFLKVSKNDALWGSSDPKAKLLDSKYGDLIGLQVKNFIEAKKEYILPGFMGEVRKRLSL